MPNVEHVVGQDSISLQDDPELAGIRGRQDSYSFMLDCHESQMLETSDDIHESLCESCLHVVRYCSRSTAPRPCASLRSPPRSG